MRQGFQLGLMAMLQAAAVQPEPPIAEPGVQALEWIAFQSDPVGRMTVPVVVNGETRRFLVDTGAERTGIAIEAADGLGLGLGSARLLTGFGGSHWVPTALISHLTLGKTKRHDVDAFTLMRGAIGADGFLGVDVLNDQLVEFDFRSRTIAIRRAPRFVQRDAFGHNAAKLQQRNRRFVFSDSVADRVPVQAFLDTGSSLTLANDALRKTLERKGRLGNTARIRFLAVTGELVPAEVAVVRRLLVGGVEIRNLPVAFVTGEPFTTLGLADEPAMLLGMDALRVFDRVAVNFRNRTVTFLKLERGNPVLMKFSRPGVQ